MKTFTRITIFACASMCFATSAIGGEAPPQMQVREVWACNFNPGKDMDDLMDVAEDYADLLPEIGAEGTREFIWAPFRANLAYDYLWFAYTPNLEAMAEISTAWASSSKAAAMDRKFDEISTCQTGMGTNEVVFNGGEPAVTTPPAFIQSWACNLNHGFTMDDVDDLDRHIVRVASASDMFRSNVLLKSVPITRSDTTRDVYYWSVHNDIGAWASRTTWQANDAEGQMLQRHADTVLDCNVGLFQSTRVVPAPE